MIVDSGTQIGFDKNSISANILKKAMTMMYDVKHMAEIYEENRSLTHYVHSTSRGHEAIQLAVGFHLRNTDFVYPYYRDEAMLLGMGFSPEQLMLQLLAKADDPFSGGRSYYSHPCSNDKGFPQIPHQSSATGMQAIPACGAAQGIQYSISKGIGHLNGAPIVVCSLGDGSVTEGEVSEAFQFAALKQLPIIFLVQDNEWGISVSSDEARSMDAFEYVAGFKGMSRMRVDGSNFVKSYEKVKEAFEFVRKERKPLLLHASVPLLGHHTSGVRKEWYRSEEDLKKHGKSDPFHKMIAIMMQAGFNPKELDKWESRSKNKIKKSFTKAKEADEPDVANLAEHYYAASPIVEETGNRKPEEGKTVVMVDAALYAVEELMQEYPEAVLYGQDVGGRLGGVFREAATLAQKFGEERVFNTAIQEAYIVGSTAGMTAAGCKPIVEIQFADYIWPSINQLATELAKSCFLSQGKYPVQSLIRVPIGAYGGGGPYHSGSVETSLLGIKGIKIVYPSNAADMKGLLKAAFLDPNPVVLLEHKGLYWSKVPGTEAARTTEPDKDYIIPLGRARIALAAEKDKVENGESLFIVTYGMGVHWSLNAAKSFEGCIEILDLRSLEPLDIDAILEGVRKHNKVIVLTEECIDNSFARNIAGLISEQCFEQLDAAVKCVGAITLPAVPLNLKLEKAMLPNTEKLTIEIEKLLSY